MRHSAIHDDKPSIAVLPFQNMSGDPEQEYLADGLTEDIITELARFSSLVVIARNSSFQWRKRSEDAKKIGHSLGAQYLVEGSVRRLGSSLRITAQLIDAGTGRHLWAERYDRPPEQLFDVQDEVVRAIVTTTEHRVMDTAADLLARKLPNNWAAYDHYLRARRYLAHYETYLGAEEPLLMAIALDPTLAQAHAGLAYVAIRKYWQNRDPKFIDEAHAHAHKALVINPNLSDAHDAMSQVYAFRNDISRAISSAERALSLNPNDVMAAADYAQWLIFAGRCEQALVELEAILRRDPIPPSWYWDTKGTALFQLRRYREAMDAYYMVNDRQSWQHAYIAACHAYVGEIDEARRMIARTLEAAPDISISAVLKIDPYQTEEAQVHLAEGLRKAGLPE
jgi:TolB-like protein